MVTTRGLIRTPSETKGGHDTGRFYDQDFYAWSQQQAETLRRLAIEMNSDVVDWSNIAEELEDLGEAQRSELESRLLVLLVHLLKWRFQPENRSSSWQGSIVEQRRRITRRLQRSPSLKHYPGEILAEEHETARLKAAGETGLPLEILPAHCPFSIDEILDDDFYPEGKC